MVIDVTREGVAKLTEATDLTEPVTVRLDPHHVPAHVPLTMEQAAEQLFHMHYKALRNKLKSLIAAGCPVVKEGRRYLFYPTHVEAWRVAKYPADARRALRLGGYTPCSDDAAKTANRQETGISTTR